VEDAGGRAIRTPRRGVPTGGRRRPDQAEAAAIETEKAFGPIDIWINNAMLSVLAPVKEITSEEFKRVMEVTFLGYI
jgi:NAD(P)-dependent dehydrogenase (short-subunit alcohol dehydrogenase family)